MPMEIAAIFGIAVVGGAIPLLVNWNERALHKALALATGVFLGAVFLHLLPAVAMEAAREAAEEAALHAGHDHGPGEHGHDHGHVHGDLLPWLFMLLGVLGVYVVEALVLRTHDHDDLHRHRAVSFAALLGLVVHALTAGLALSAVDSERIRMAMLLAILAHKGFESFSLTTVFKLGHFTRKQLILVTLGFALVTPLGILLGDSLASGLGEKGVGMLNALAAGTFLYVCLCELLTEVFHHREDGLGKMVLLSLGVAAMWLAHYFGGI